MWWEKAVIYQIYPFSFMDSNGDGIGDLRGVINKLDYLQKLGIDAVWLSPFYPSPWVDCGYDVADYTNIHPQFGTLAEFDEFLAKAHSREIRVIIDFVPNHSSDQHPWFLESRSSRDNPKHDWYVWANSAKDGGVPTDHESFFVPVAWTYVPERNQYYFHQFYPGQPDLNWCNLQVRESLFNVLKFWLNRGVDGFRVDVPQYIAREFFLDDQSQRAGLEKYALRKDELHKIIREMREICDSYPGERLLIGETGNDPEWYGIANDEFHIPFNFSLMGCRGKAVSLRQIVEETEKKLPNQKAWPNYVLASHDTGRIASRYGSNNVRLLAMFLLTLRGTPTLYYGDEISMTHVEIPPDRIKDAVGRDKVRTPMQWDDSPFAGFSTSEPWLPVGQNFYQINVKKQQADKKSLLAFYRKLIYLRRRTPALLSGNYEMLVNPSEHQLLYVRSARKQKILVALNFSDKETLVMFDGSGKQGKILLSTHCDRRGSINLTKFTLRSHEGLIVKISGG